MNKIIISRVHAHEIGNSPVRPGRLAIGIAEAGIGPGKSAGNDLSRPWPQTAVAEPADAAVRIGRRLWAEHRTAGLFGLDALLAAEGQVLCNEISCRNQGTTEVSAANQQRVRLF